MESNLTETKTETLQYHKLCGLCNKIQKFKVIQHKTKGEILSGRKCIACTSKKNNERLKSKGYYKTYYQQHAEEMKAKDKLRYQKRKEEANLVKFNFDNGNILVQPVGGENL